MKDLKTLPSVASSLVNHYDSLMLLGKMGFNIGDLNELDDLDATIFLHVGSCYNEYLADEYKKQDKKVGKKIGKGRRRGR